MSIQTINLGGGLNIPPPLDPNAVQNATAIPPTISQTKPLMSDDDIDKLIEAQQAQTTKPIHQNIPIQDTQLQGLNTQPLPEEEEKETNEEKFNLSGMNLNLDDIRLKTLARIDDLNKKQVKISARIELIEKFIVLDEKSLAIESSRQEPNLQKIIGIKKSIYGQTELISEVTDILLKFEAQIQGWYKTLMDIEKDKVSAYGKIKALNKEQTSTETDINDVMANLNSILKNDPNKLLSTAANTLSISGYDGKKFMG